MSTQKPLKIHSLDQAAGAFAATKLSEAKPAELLASLRRQGIGSLDDLVNATIKAAQEGRRSGSFSDDDFVGYCYKFMSYRPIFNQVTEGDLNQFNQQVRQEIG